MSVTALNGTTWILNNSLTYSPFTYTSQYITFTRIKVPFTSNGNNYTQIQVIVNNGVNIQYDTQAAVYYQDKWEDSSGNPTTAYKTITFTGSINGSQDYDATEDEAIAWLEANATLAKDEVEVSYKGSVIASINTSDVITLDTAGTWVEDDITVEYTRPSAPSPALQSKTVSPSLSSQTVSPDSGYDGLSSVTVSAMPSGSAATPATTISLYPTITVGNDGTITASVNTTSSVTPTVVPGYVSSGTAGTITVDGESIEYLTTQSAQTITPTTTDQTIASGKYLTGTQTIKGDANLVAGNIKNGTMIFGVTGSYVGGGTPTLQSKTVTPSGSTISVTPDSGYDGLSDVTVNPITLKMGVELPAAELAQTYSYDKLIVTNEGINLPSYSTSAKTLIDTKTLTNSFQFNLANYDYYILMRALTTPVYNTATPAKGRQEYLFSAAAFEIINIPPSSFVSANGKYYTSRNTNTLPVGALNKLFYWSSASAVSVYNGATYGLYQTIQTPTMANGSTDTPTITIMSPIFGYRSSTNYLPSNVYSTITDVRFQYVINIYRIARGTYNLNGWGIAQQGLSIIDNTRGNGTLT